nr:hypothetical protein [Lysinibacillus timonensis]
MSRFIIKGLIKYNIMEISTTSSQSEALVVFRNRQLQEQTPYRG